MKFRFLTFFFLVSLLAEAQYSKVPLELLDTDIRARAFNFVFRIYNAESINDFPKINKTEATNYFIKHYNKTRSSLENINYTWYNEHYGNIKNIKLNQVLVDNKERHIYRYKVSYTETDLSSEIRLTLNKNQKYIGLIRKYFWKDKFYKWDKTLPKIEINIDSIPSNLLALNEEFVLKSFNTCKASDMFPLDENNTTRYSHKKSFSEIILKGCDSIKLKHGDLNYLKLKEVLTDSFRYKAYRYKALFSKKKDTLEIRVFTNMKNQFSGLWETYWFDTYHHVNRMPKKLK